MVANVDFLVNAPFSTLSLDTGISDDARELRSRFLEILESLSLSVALGDRFRVLAELNSAYREASQENWDGYGAQKAQAASMKYAKDFLFALPSIVPQPEVSIDPDGEISFTWQRAPRLVFSVSISKDGVLSYAGLFGRNKKAHGTEDFIQTIPKAITDNLERLFSAEG
jgi:hypothetical protein